MVEGTRPVTVYHLASLLSSAPFPCWYASLSRDEERGAMRPWTQFFYQPGARGLLPSGMRMNGPLPPGDQCAIVRVFARAMNPCWVGFGPVLFAQSNVRGVVGSNLSRRRTFAVSLDASKYLGASASSSTGGHPARSSVGFAQPRSPCVHAWGVSRVRTCGPYHNCAMRVMLNALRSTGSHVQQL